MKRLPFLLVFLAWAVGAQAANPTFSSFDTNYFTTNNFVIRAKNASPWETNAQGYITPRNLTNFTPFNARTFNADPTGLTDSTAKFKAMIAAARTNETTCLIPRGTYIISSPIVISNGVRISFQGESTLNSIQPLTGTILKLADGANCDMIVKEIGGILNVKGLVLDGNKANQTTTNLSGLWLKGSSVTINRCSVEDSVIQNVSGWGIRNDAREARFYRINLDSCAKDGIMNTASSDTTFQDILAGFNGGHGVAMVGANSFRFDRGDLYRNGTNGLFMVNCNNNMVVGVKTDANTREGTVVGSDPGFVSYRNRFDGCSFNDNNFYLDQNNNPTPVASGTYANVRLYGDNTTETTFVACNFWEGEAIYAMTLPKQELFDNRNYFETNLVQGTSLVVLGCSFKSSGAYVVDGAYSTNFVHHAAGYWFTDGGIYFNDSPYWLSASTVKMRVTDQLEADLGLQVNAYYAGTNWYYRADGVAYMLRARRDNPILGLQYASSNAANAVLTLASAVNINSTNGTVAIGYGDTPAETSTALDVNGNVKGALMESADGLTSNAYYVGTNWLRRAAGCAYQLQAQAGYDQLVLKTTDSNAANSVITWTQGIWVSATNGATAVWGELLPKGKIVMKNLGIIYGSNYLASSTIEMIKVDQTNRVSIAGGGEDTLVNGELQVNGAIHANSYMVLPNNTWLYGSNAVSAANIAAIGIDAADQVRLAPNGQKTVIAGNADILGDATITGTLSAPLLSLGSITSGSMETTNGVLFLPLASGPAAADIGAGNGQQWLSNDLSGTLYFRVTSDGATYTDYNLSQGGGGGSTNGANWTASGPSGSALTGDATIGGVITAGGGSITGDLKTRGPIFDVRSYGAVEDGTTDDYTPIQNAINAAQVKGGTVYFPATTTAGYAIAQPLIITNNVSLVGDSHSGYFFDLNNSQQLGSRLRWRGTGGTMLTIQPSSLLLSRPVINVVVKNLMFDGRSFADTAVRVESCYHPFFDNVAFRDCTNVCLWIGAYSGASYTGSPLTYGGTFHNISISQRSTNYPGVGIRFDGDADNSYAYNGSSTLCTFTGVNIAHCDGTAVEFVRGDHHTIINLNISRRAVGTGLGIDLKGVASGRGVNYNTFIGGYFDAGSVHSRTAANSASHNNFYSYSLADNGALPTVENGGSGMVVETTDGQKIAYNGVGIKFGTGTTNKLGFYGATPIIQPNSSTDIRTAIINLGLLNSSSTAATSFDALSPNTTRGDLTVRGASSNNRLAIGSFGTRLASDGTDPIWKTGRAFLWYEDDLMMFSTSANSLGMQGSSVGTGATQAATTGTTNHPGVLRVETGTTTNGVSSYINSTTAFLFSGGRMVYSEIVSVPVLSESTDIFRVQVGFLDNRGAAGMPTDGALFVYSTWTGAGYTNTGKWSGVTTSNATYTEVPSSITVTAGQYYLLQVDVNALGTQADFYIDGVLIGSSVTNLPNTAGREFGCGSKIDKLYGTVGTTSSAMDVDYVSLGIKLTTSR